MSDRDLPEGVIDAEPAGGWTSVNDTETTEQNADAAGSTELADATSSADRGHPEEVDAEEVESAEPSQGVDPDMGVEQ